LCPFWIYPFQNILENVALDARIGNFISHNPDPGQDKSNETVSDNGFFVPNFFETSTNTLVLMTGVFEVDFQVDRASDILQLTYRCTGLSENGEGYCGLGLGTTRMSGADVMYLSYNGGFTSLDG
jgi:hypothetical protein